MEFGAARKRGRPDAAFNGNGGFKKSKQEMESFPPGIGSKLKPCTKFFSTAGCPFGESCHFLHYVPGGIKAVTQMLGNNPALPSATARNPVVPPSFPDGSSPPAVKTRMCNKYNTAEGCRFGDKCHFAHGEWELGKPSIQSHEDPRDMGPMGAAGLVVVGWNHQHPQGWLRRLALVPLPPPRSVLTLHLLGPSSEKVIGQASAMVRELIVNLGSVSKPPPMKGHGGPGSAPHGSNYKTKLCENFAKGSCTFGDRCHFAHGADELRNT
ncbi:KH domain-containing protein [Actinidia rufa]|uniref:KH domain-containing protein n=1 Tax=Actinidia rufa TaxID=165716 RepID=A0A7J0HCG2_9ERIC|nr:KH domain-containing protein [Actinidia rufa]